jgi:hypothetical protein
VFVENTPLEIPMLVTAERGVQAIKDFFNEIKENKQRGGGTGNPVSGLNNENLGHHHLESHEENDVQRESTEPRDEEDLMDDQSVDGSNHFQGKGAVVKMGDRDFAEAIV